MFLAGWQVRSGLISQTSTGASTRGEGRGKGGRGVEESRRGVRPAFAASAIGAKVVGDLFTSCSGRSCSGFASLAFFVWVSLSLS
jgi:hypothetical protein